jgi:hypothetical protein
MKADQVRTSISHSIRDDVLGNIWRSIQLNVEDSVDDKVMLIIREEVWSNVHNVQDNVLSYASAIYDVFDDVFSHFQTNE